MSFMHRLLADIFIKRTEQKFIKKLQHFSPPTNLDSNLYPDKVCFKHIGLLGDIIYSIPCMLALAKGKKIELLLDITQDTMYTTKQKHYAESKILTEKSVSFIRPLILSNSAFSDCRVHNGEAIDYDLNEFRRYPFDYRMGHICRWYFLTFGVNYDLGKPWLNVEPDAAYKDEIIITRTFRYRTPLIDYSFLNKWPNLSFIGLQEEYEDMKKVIPGIKYIVTKDALQLARTMAGCKLFVGNQSFVFAVAEAIKITRVLELSYYTPVAIVEGSTGYDFCYQPQFEKIIHELTGI
jgi:hypothetical protein